MMPQKGAKIDLVIFILIMTDLLTLNKFCVFKGRVHCFSMHIVMNKCFLLNPEKNLAQILLVVFEKNAHYNFEK